MESQVNLKRASTRTANLPQKRLAISTEPFDHLTHYLFRYPAKFHPPVARALLDHFTRAGTGRRSVRGKWLPLVEALAMGRNAIGLDIDPVAVAVTSAKIHRYDPKTLRTAAAAVVRAAKHFNAPPPNTREECSKTFRNANTGHSPGVRRSYPGNSKPGTLVSTLRRRRSRADTNRNRKRDPIQGAPEFF